MQILRVKNIFIGFTKDRERRDRWAASYWF